jgi:hypothetical protein
MAVNPIYSYLHVTAATGTVVKASSGALAGVSINKALVGTVTLKDGGTTIAVLTNSSGPIGQTLMGPIAFASLNVSLSTAAEDITIIYE